MKLSNSQYTMTINELAAQTWPKQEAKLIARWESRSGKHWVELFYNPEFKLANGDVVIDAHYRGVGCGGGIAATSEADAIAKMAAEVAKGRFQPDANKTPMKRVG